MFSVRQAQVFAGHDNVIHIHTQPQTVDLDRDFLPQEIIDRMCGKLSSFLGREIDQEERDAMFTAAQSAFGNYKALMACIDGDAVMIPRWQAGHSIGGESAKVDPSVIYGDEAPHLHEQARKVYEAMRVIAQFD